MRIKLAALVGSLIAVAAMALAVLASSPAAQAATLSPAPSASTQASLRPMYTAHVTVTVRCRKFVGKINHGGTGGLLNRAYLQVEGKLSSSCNSRTELTLGTPPVSRASQGLSSRQSV